MIEKLRANSWESYLKARAQCDELFIVDFNVQQGRQSNAEADA
jgi:hypothetical protein